MEYYKYHHNKYDNIHYLTSTQQKQEIIDYINIYISNQKTINWDTIKKEIKNYKLINNFDKILIEDKYNIFNINIKSKYYIIH